MTDNREHDGTYAVSVAPSRAKEAPPAETTSPAEAEHAIAHPPFSGYAIARRPLNGSRAAVIVVADEEYPYVIHEKAAARLQGDDVLRLESDDGAYAEEVAIGRAALQADGSRVAWFPAPPAGARLRARLRRFVRGEDGAEREESFFFSYDRPVHLEKPTRSGA